MTANRTINYLGWLGYKNLGDEALYKVISQIFKPYNLFPVKMNYTDHSIFSPVTIIGGSTGIPEWLETFRPTRYNYIFGAGVKDPAFLGYDYIFKDRLKVKVMFEKLRIFRYMGVRGNISKALLLKHGIDSEVIGDPCLSLRPTVSQKKDKSKIAISIGSDGILWGMNEKRLFHEIAKVCQKLRRDGYELILIPFWENNVEAVRSLAEEENIEFFEDWFNIESTLNLIANCHIFIGQKLHSLVFSAAAGTPFIGLGYQPKCYDFTESVGFEKYTIRTDSATDEKIMELFSNLTRDYEAAKTRLKKSVNIYRTKQKEFAESIIRDINTLPEHFWRPPAIQRRIKNNLFWNVDYLLHEKTALWYTFNRICFKNLLTYMT